MKDPRSLLSVNNTCMSNWLLTFILRLLFEMFFYVSKLFKAIIFIFNAVKVINRFYDSMMIPFRLLMLIFESTYSIETFSNFHVQNISSKMRFIKLSNTTFMFNWAKVKYMAGRGGQPTTRGLFLFLPAEPF